MGFNEEREYDYFVMTRLRAILGCYQGQLPGGLAAAIAWLILIFGEVIPDVNRVTQGFAAYYAASYAVLHGGAAALTDDRAFAGWVTRSGIGIHEVFAGNVPTLSLLTIPFTVVSPDLAQTLWLILNVGILAVATWLAIRLCAPRNVTTGWWIVAAFALLSPVHEAIRYGQVYLLLALLSLIIVSTLQRGHDILAGIALAGTVLLKPFYGVLILGLLVWSRRPRSILASTVAILVVVIGSIPLLAQAWPGFPGAEFNISDVAWAGIPANQTLNSLSQHLFLYTPGWNPEPLANLPWLAKGLHYALVLILVGATAWQAISHRDNPLWIWPSALTLMPVLAPVGEVHHLSMLLLPLAVGVTRVVDKKTGRLASGLIVASLILLIIPWPSLHDPAIWGGWRGLFAYPRLLGALLLWAALTLRPGEHLLPVTRSAEISLAVAS